ncbi:MAG TPA: hypothetical protein VHG70_01755 [Nocardioidaceae bacterium]|nr:hypothetical protein [Nocardioidaceae bacterium]
MRLRRDLVRFVRWPLSLLGVSAAAILVAVVLDRTPAREYALVIGGPALTVLLPVAVVWLVVALAVYGRRTRSSP